MKKQTKTFKKKTKLNKQKLYKNKLCYKTNKISHNKNLCVGKNKIMEKENKKIGSCKVHVMPSQISDNDISALFNGLLNVVKKKFELDFEAQFINYNINIDNLKRELKNKINECNRLKNEIINLKSQLEKQN